MKRAVKKIVAIGGGDIRRGSTVSIDKEIIRLTGKKSPKLLFLPTASSDHAGYWKHVRNYFRGNKLGCETDVLFLIKESPSSKEIRKKIHGADVIYVGGGNTLKMMRLWRRLGVDTLLKKAWEKGIVLCGMSAGSICWFESGHSDSMSFYSPKQWEYINVRGLGFIKGIHCPHFNSHTLGIPRKNSFRHMIQKIGGMGIAIDNNCAIEFLNDEYRVIASKEYANAYRVFKKNSKIYSERILQSEEFRLVSELYKR